MIGDRIQGLAHSCFYILNLLLSIFMQLQDTDVKNRVRMEFQSIRDSFVEIEAETATGGVL